MAVYGYGRVSTNDKGQTTENQRMKIAEQFTMTEFFSDSGVSGSVPAMIRPAFKALLEKAVDGDTIIVTAVDRLGRNAVDALTVVELVKTRNIKLRIMQFDGVDLTSPTGKMIVTVMLALAEMEKNLLIERTKDGLNRTKEQGTKLGAPLTVTPAELREAVTLKGTGLSWEAVAEKLGAPKSTLHRTAAAWGDKLDDYEKEFKARKTQYAAKMN